MKNIRKFIVVSLVIFSLIVIGISSWYILSLNYMEEYDLKAIIKIITQIGIVGAIIPSLTISLIYYLMIKIENKLLLLFLIIFLIIFLIFQIYVIALKLFFYDINGSVSFLNSLIKTLIDL
ncbi:hypothetical protein [Flavobacterium davisii]|uniref:hypothetical protein n=1 Tax=Flavobacterium davisii TaxID=2906077 RepID=UPI0035CF3C13